MFDLREVVKCLFKEMEILEGSKGKVSKEVVKFFLVRVLFYEVMWEKYVFVINYDLDGDGSLQGVGIVKLEGYFFIIDMLIEVKQMLKEVIEEVESGIYKLWVECDFLSYYYLFNIDDKGGNIFNFKSVGKSMNKEFIFLKKYDYDLSCGGINLLYLVMVGVVMGMSVQFGEFFFCCNGFFICISYIGSMFDVQNNLEFEGYVIFIGEYCNCDYCFVGCIFLFDCVFYSSCIEDGC